LAWISLAALVTTPLSISVVG